MNSQLQTGIRRRHRRGRSVWGMLATLALLLTVMLSPMPAVPNAAAAAPQAAPTTIKAPIQAAPLAAPELTNTITLRVVNARTEPRAFGGTGVIVGEPITTTYQFMINEDNTGDPFDSTDCFAYTDPPTNTIVNPNYPDGCDWPGVRTNPGWSPIVTKGTQDDLNETTGITLPPGKYVISVLADGYKNDGIHFTIPVADPGLLTVAVHPHPLPPATMVIQVFHDRSSTNGQFDAPVEEANGLAGFRAIINDMLGEVTTDIFGNPLCTEYVHDGNGDVVLNPDGTPQILTLGNGCFSDANGIIRIPNIGTIRWDVLVVPPDGSNWVQTTTLEGSLGWDTWLQEAGTGLDNEFIVAGEPFPWTIFGFVAPTNTLPIDPAGTGTVRGVIMGITSYSPSQGGLPYQGTIWGGYNGVKLDAPVSYPWLALNDLQNGDTAVWVGQGNADGSFEIPNVPPGNYFLSYWDGNLHYILDWMQVTVKPNQTTDIGIRTMTNWFTKWYGTVFLDNNENGRRDPGEPGVPDYLVVLKDRENTEIDRMSISSMTDPNGNYELEKGYPMGSWMILEAYSDIYRTTGITFQASNQPTETTILGAGVDVDVLPILSQWGRLDWGVKFYEPNSNGGIVGTVFYDTMRAEDDAAYAGAEPWQPGIPELEMRLYATVKVNGIPVTDTLPGPNHGAYVKGPLLNTATTETFARPKDCIARDVDGNPVNFPSLPQTAGQDCLEAPLTGVQFGTEFATLDGNYGFTEILTDPLTGAPLPAPIPLPPDDYLVEVVIPNDPILGRPVFEVTREEDVNIYDGDEFYPLVAPPECGGPWHIVDVAGIGTDGYAIPWDPGNFSTPVDNPGYVEAGGSRFEGLPKPLCNVKLITLEDRKSIAPIFNLHTPVPIPGRWRGYIVDDLNVSVNPLELTFGEKAGLHNSPIGVYDFTGRLVHTVHSDYHGVYEALLPSSATYNAPSPTGQLAGVYYIYGNDPGQPGHMNSLYNPQYRSIGTSFEIYPGNMMPSDLAPTQTGALIWAPGSQQDQLAQCALEPTTPQLFTVSRPYVGPTGGRSFTISGIGFGATRGSGSVRLESRSGTPIIQILPITSWSDRQIVASVPPALRAGPYQLTITRNGGRTAVNTVTFHVLGTAGGSTYNPALFEVGPARPYATIQSAIDAAAVTGNSLVVVYPGPTTPFTNPLGIWFENPVIYSRVKLQGIGPGGVYTDGTGVLGSVLDGRAVGGDTPYSVLWLTLMGDIWLNRGGWDGSPIDGDGNPTIFPGPVVTVLAEDGEFNQGFPVTIDGFAIQGGDQQGFPNNLDQIGGVPIPGVAAQVSVQGGGIYVNGYGRYVRITNNVVQTNGGGYAGAIRLGTPNMPVPFKDNQNDNVTIANNRLLANGGTNLAGAIGVFAGANNYDIASNDICGNFSAEYGGAISHYGYSPNGRIHNNRIYYNRSYDEGGGIMIAGELPADPAQLSPGAGPVDIYANLVQSNLSNDDGGGIRFLMAGDFLYRVYNNIVVNNVSTHEGGGISLNDAPRVRIYNNTIMKNITTATAMTSNGLPAPAGLSSAQNSALLQATLPPGSPIFSNPQLFNNIFWDNRAGWTENGTVSGIGMEGDPNAIFYWDLGTGDGSGTMSPTYCLLQVPYGAPSPTNRVGLDPVVVQQYDTSVRVLPWRGNPNFVGIDLVALNNPVTLMGNYHLAAGSPAINAGTASKSGQAAPTVDYDGQRRPMQGLYEIGADEYPNTQAFPLAGVLYPSDLWGGQAASQPASLPEADAQYKIYLPLIYNVTLTPWLGQLDAFAFDPFSGVQVLASGYSFWNPGVFSADQEAYFTFTALSPSATRQDLLLKVGGLAPDGLIGPDTYLIDVGYDATTGRIQVSTLEPGDLWVSRMVLEGIELDVGDQFGARTSAGGLVEVYRNGELLFTVDLANGDTPWPYNDTRGRIGFWFEAPSFDGSDGAGLTDLGGGVVP